MKFIHTFSLMRYCEKDEIEALRANYEENAFRYIRNEKLWMLIPYTNYGLKLVIKALPYDSKRRKFSKVYHSFEMIIYITPAKLLNPGECLGGLTSKVEIEKACAKLKELANIIEKKSDVNILSEACLWRVDLTKDQPTPSDLYSRELIAALKKSIVKKGYHLYDPRTNDDYNVAWRQEDSMMFYNNNKRVGGKVYNKKRDLTLYKHHDELIKIGDRGLLRFELSLLYQRLKEDYEAGGNMTCERLSEILWAVTNDSSMLFEKYFTQIFFPGIMVSRKLMKANIKHLWPNKDKQLDQMMNYSDFITGKKITNEKKMLSNQQIAKRKTWFNEIGISPVALCRDCSYIPSVADLLEDRNNVELGEFLQDWTTMKFDFIYWKK